MSLVIAPRLQEFHEQGEKETLVAEISALRDQVCEESSSYFLLCSNTLIQPLMKF